MKHYLACTLTLFTLILTITFAGTGFAGTESADIDQPMVQAQDDTADLDVAGITISGTINESNQLIDLQGKAFELSDNTDEGLEVKALVGQKVELKGTVLDEEGQQIMEVLEYRLLEK
ncbi:hypothetical protein JCM14469_12350 [Desulfatiferula olefinivorans]